MLNKVGAWHRTKSGLIVFGAAELAICYGFASLAIDRGNLLYYALTLLFLVGSLRNTFTVLKLVKERHGRRART